MQQLSPFNQDGVVGYFLRKRVLKDILRIRKCRLLVNKFATLEDSERAVQVRMRLPCYLSDELKGKFPPNNRNSLQQFLFIWRQPIYARGEDGLDSRGNLYVGKRTGEFNSAVTDQ